MEERWCEYNTLLDAITELEIPSEKATNWLRHVNINENNVEFSNDELEIYKQLLPHFHREFLQYKHYPKYAIKTSLARLLCKEEGAKDLWNEAALIHLSGVPSAMSVIKLSILVYPLIDFAVMRRQLCQSIIFEIKKGNLKPYFYPDCLEDRGMNEKEKLQAFIKLPLTEQVSATIEINEFGNGLAETESFPRKAYTLWRRYHDRARGLDKPVKALPRPAEKTQNRKAIPLRDTYFVDCGGKYAELFRDADQAYRESFSKHPTAVALFDNLTTLCPHLVKEIDSSTGKREARKLIFVGGDYLAWKSFLKAFKRYFPALSD